MTPQTQEQKIWYKFYTEHHHYARELMTEEQAQKFAKEFRLTYEIAKD